MNAFRYCAVLISLLVLITNVPAQSPKKFKAIDKHVKETPKSLAKDLPKLVTYLTKSSSSELETVRSFYSWILQNISYDHEAYKDGKKRINHSNQDVLKRQKAVCYGYSSLFKEMCHLAEIPCEIITGYPKMPRDEDPDLSTANHTWNAVQIDGNWHLLDVTWGAGEQKDYKEHYFLTAPEIFILDHLPKEPMWQLLDCPIQAPDFNKAEDQITAQITNQNPCFDYQDSITAHFTLIAPKRLIKAARMAYLFHPNAENKKMLGSALMDYNSYLTDRSSILEQTDSTEAILAIQLEMIKTCEQAAKYVTLFDKQKENYAYTHFNYAVALYQQLLSLEDPKDQEVLEYYQTMLFHFKKARSILSPLPQDFLIKNAMLQLDEYLEYVEIQLENLQ